jgi:hypothetical protein
MRVITQLEWYVLDCLSDGKETVDLILSAIKQDFPEITCRKVVECVYGLHKDGLVFEDGNKKLEHKILISESVDYTKNAYWFGLTEKGCKYWEDYSYTYTGETISWEDAWIIGADYQNLIGYVDGTSLKACSIGLEKFEIEKGWQIDRNCLKNSKIEGFKPKYYKEIKGGYRVTFNLKKTNDGQ